MVIKPRGDEMNFIFTEEQVQAMDSFYAQWPTTETDERFVMEVYDILGQHGESTSIANIAGYIQESRGDLDLSRFSIDYVRACLYRGNRRGL